MTRDFEPSTIRGRYGWRGRRLRTPYRSLRGSIAFPPYDFRKIRALLRRIGIEEALAIEMSFDLQVRSIRWCYVPLCVFEAYGRGLWKQETNVGISKRTCDSGAFAVSSLAVR